MEKVTGGTGEEQLAASRILAVTEEELKRIILDLHDGPVQQLFAAQAQMGSLQSRLNHGEAIPNDVYQLTFERVSRLLEASLAEIRQFLGTFRPPDFASQSLVEMLHGLFMHHELTTGVVIDFRVLGGQLGRSAEHGGSGWRATGNASNASRDQCRELPALVSDHENPSTSVERCG